MKWYNEFWAAGSGDTKCFIDYDPMRQGLRFYFSHSPYHEDKIYAGRFQQPSYLEGTSILEFEEEREPGTRTDPTFVLQMYETNAFLEAIIEFIKDADIKTSNENFNQGKLEATLEHLEDMQKLVFDKPMEKE